MGGDLQYVLRTQSDHTSDKLGLLVVNLPALLAQDIPAPHAQTESLFHPSPPPGMSSSTNPTMPRGC